MSLTAMLPGYRQDLQETMNIVTEKKVVIPMETVPFTDQSLTYRVGHPGGSFRWNHVARNPEKGIPASIWFLLFQVRYA